MANPQPASTIYFADGKSLDVIETPDALVSSTYVVYGPMDPYGVRPSWVSRGQGWATRTTGKRVWVNYANVCRVEEA